MSLVTMLAQPVDMSQCPMHQMWTSPMGWVIWIATLILGVAASRRSLL